MRKPVLGRESDLAVILAVALILAPLMGLAAVAAAEAIPDTVIADRLLEGRKDGTLGARDYTRSPLDTTTVHRSECVLLSLGLGDFPGTSSLTTVLESRTYRTCPNLDHQLTIYEDEHMLPPGTPYLRYWHGYSPLTRPSLALFGVAGTRWVAFGLLTLTMLVLLMDVRLQGGTAAALLLVMPVLLTTDAVLGGLSILQALAIWTAWIGGWLCFRLVRKRPSWVVAGLAAALAGSVASYADLLTTMPGAWTMSVAGATLAASAPKTHGPVSGWRIPLAATVGWMLGMAGMWASKWLLAMFFFGRRRVLDDVLSQIAFRISGTNRRVDQSPFAGLTDNLEFWWNRPLTPLVVLFVLGVLILLWIRGRQRLGRHGLSAIAIVIVIIVVPHLAWYVVLNNHSQLHVAIVYRSLPLALGGLAAWIGSVLSNKSSVAIE